MTTPILGLGLSPLGVGPYGLGTPAVAPTPGGAVYRDDQGVQQNGRAISIARGSSGQYVYDEFGRAKGMPDVHQMLILAAGTVKGSSVSRNLGQRFFEARYITTDFERQQRTRVEEAFKDLVDRGLIRIDAVEVMPGNGEPAVTLVKTTDLLTNRSLPDLRI